MGNVAYMVRQWEKHVAERNKKRIFLADHSFPYEFPRWRSNDALTASLVVSKENISIPVDSKLPIHRLKMMQETERISRINKAISSVQGKTVSTTNSKTMMDSNTLQLDYQPWYDHRMISKNIIRDSIANSIETRKRFENGLIWNDHIISETNKLHERIHGEKIKKSQECRDDAPEIIQFVVKIRFSAEK